MNVNFTQQFWGMKEWARVAASGSTYVSLVHDATNEDKWGPTGPQMEEVCAAFPRGGSEIMKELRSRLNNRDKAWRPCYKSLLVLDYLARNVADRFLPEICTLVPLLRTISQSFYYTNPKGVDHGVSVRERSKLLADLLSDGLLLREEREKAAATKAKLSNNASEAGGPNTRGGYSSNSYGNYGGAYRPSPTVPQERGPRYDPYPPGRSAPRSREEQEQYDLEMAMRMQRDEERRAGVSAEQLEAMYSQKVQQKKATEQRQQAAANEDEELARRLQEEEDQRARQTGQTLPQFRSDAPAASAPAEPTPAPTPEKPKENVLDDLFAPAPAPAPSQPAAGGGSGGDPFDAFLNTHAQQQQQQPPAGAWSQPAPPAQNTAATNAWGGGVAAPQAPNAAPNPWGQPQAPPPPPQQSNPWGAPEQQQSGQWGQPAAPSNAWGQPQVAAPASSNASAPWGSSASAPQPAMYQNNTAPANNNMNNNNMWGQPSAPAPSNDPWGAPQQQQSGQWTQQPPTQVSNSTHSAGGGDMWSALDKFSNQQQYK